MFRRSRIPVLDRVKLLLRASPRTGRPSRLLRSDIVGVASMAGAPLIRSRFPRLRLEEALVVLSLLDTPTLAADVLAAVVGVS